MKYIENMGFIALNYKYRILINFKYLRNYKYYNEETNLWIMVGLINSIKLKIIEESI